jgi:hypothetical protein
VKNESIGKYFERWGFVVGNDFFFKWQFGKKFTNQLVIY